jgi:hypothetical protein
MIAFVVVIVSGVTIVAILAQRSTPETVSTHPLAGAVDHP